MKNQSSVTAAFASLFLLVLSACGSTKTGGGTGSLTQNLSDTQHSSQGTSTGTTCAGSTTTASSGSANGGTGSATDPNNSTSSSGSTTSSATQFVADPNQPAEAISGLTWTNLSNTELFSKSGPGQSEILQGTANDCTVFAALGSITEQDPNYIVNMITSSGKTSDGSQVYTVHLYEYSSGAAVNIEVDDKLLTGSNSSMPYDPLYADPSNNKVILWPHLVQKAFAVYYGGYENIAESASANIPILTGVKASRLVSAISSKEASSAALQKVVGKGYVVTADSSLAGTQPADLSTTTIVQNGEYYCASVSGSSYCLAMAHEYEVIAYDGITVTLRNPWGTNIGAGVSTDGIVAIPIEAYDALIPATWAENSPTLTLN